MIGRILYRESCQGMLDYVFGKEGMRILGYGNMYSQAISQKFFGKVLHFQGQRNATKNRYAHITLNLPHGEHLDDKTFHEVSKEYMEQMGYGEQPYVTVRHNDTEHEHIHIITTNVTGSGKVLGIFNSFRRNIATQQYLEKKFGLTPSPRTKQQRELPLYRLPELQFGMDPAQGTKFYLQDVLNSILQKYKVRSFKELEKLIEPYHIEIKQTKNRSGRIGVAFGLDNQKGYRTRFINGSIVHPSLSGPKLQNAFDANSKSKLLPMHRKRLLKQIETTYGLFKSIRPHDLPEVIKEYQGIDIKLDIKGDDIKGYTIHDKSGYAFKESELSPKIGMEKRLDIFGNGDGPTEIDTDSNQFKLEVQKLIKEAFRTSYLNSSDRNGLFSENIMARNPMDILPHIKTSKDYIFLERYLPGNQKKLLLEALKREFPTVRDRLYQLEEKKEKETLVNKFRLIGRILENGIFDVGKEKGSVHRLFRSLGVKYNDNRLSFSNSNKHTVPVLLGDLPFPKAMDTYVSTGFVRQNHMVLEMLTARNSDIGPELTASSFFLPMVFPKLYEAMAPMYRQQYESAALGSYLKHAERMHAPYEKSPKDYMALFNAKGFYFVKGKDGFEVKSVYTDHRTSCPLPKRTNLYLNSILDVTATLLEQRTVINGLVSDGRNDLKNLWAGHLIERGMYDRAAFMLTGEKVYPNLHGWQAQHHMDNGLRKSINKALERESTIEQNRLLRKGVYAISSLLGNRAKGQEEVYNGFKDEFTDWSKYKGRGISM
ncbi:relaxase/mobilization nuclease domain-containing protein [Arenibacter palladensis]|uniref:relaxase/mobilization nuclease domain-containing protein n=1 Tax=Arenibacter palladensis TaxID=237373 RepID=UPI0026E27568|nr:relaxase/mobilization nuclease domain-containing protein [Arenibacter palladensis]MDO6604050.1 relaxase/mobilization nuclease domain-containing protein [Arenibacter palladensis]